MTPRGKQRLTIINLIFVCINCFWLIKSVTDEAAKMAKPSDVVASMSKPTEWEMYRLDNNLILYEPSTAVFILQQALVGEGYKDLVTDGIFGNATQRAIVDYQQKQKQKGDANGKSKSVSNNRN